MVLGKCMTIVNVTNSFKATRIYFLIIDVVPIKHAFDLSLLIVKLRDKMKAAKTGKVA